MSKFNHDATETSEAVGLDVDALDTKMNDFAKQVAEDSPIKLSQIMERAETYFTPDELSLTTAQFVVNKLRAAQAQFSIS